MTEKSHPDMSFEREARSSGFLYVAGVDEAGRGPLAGPVVAGAVILPELPEELSGLNDSKQLTAAKRERLFLALLDCEQVACSVGMASVEEIDRLNILRATHLAMARAVEGLAPHADFCLVDGLPVKGLPVPHRAIVKGDEGPHDDGGGCLLSAVRFCKTQGIWHESPHGSPAEAWALSASSPLVCAGFTNGTVHS